MAQEERVAHHDEQSLGPGYSHVEPLEGRSARVRGGKDLKEGIAHTGHQPSNLGVLKETEVEVQIQLHEALAAPHGGDEDDAAFLALELFHGAHLEGERQGLQPGARRGNRGPRPLLREPEVSTKASAETSCTFVTVEGLSRKESMWIALEAET